MTEMKHNFALFDQFEYARIDESVNKELHDNCSALSERFTALYMQSVLVELLAMTIADFEQADKMHDIYVANVKFLDECEYDVTQARDVSAQVRNYQFSDYAQALQFITSLCALVTHELA